MQFNDRFFKDNVTKTAVASAVLGAAGFIATSYFANAMVAPLATTIASYMPAAFGFLASMLSGFGLMALAATAAAVIAGIAGLAIVAAFLPKEVDVERKDADADPAKKDPAKKDPAREESAREESAREESAGELNTHPADLLEHDGNVRPTV